MKPGTVTFFSLAMLVGSPAMAQSPSTGTPTAVGTSGTATVSATVSTNGMAAIAPLPTDETLAADTDPEAVKALDLFNRGVQALNAAQNDEAVKLFDDAHKVRRTAPIAFNRGVALRLTGKLVEARDSFREFFELANDTLLAGRSGEVRGYLTELTRKIGTVRIEALDPPSAVITVDDRRVIPNASNAFDINPGPHVIIVEAGSHETVRKALLVTEHGSHPLQISLVRTGAGGHSSIEGPGISEYVAPPSEALGTLRGSNAVATPRGPSIASSPIFWTIIGVVVVGGVVGGIVGWQSSLPAEPPPSSSGVNIRIP